MNQKSLGWWQVILGILAAGVWLDLEHAYLTVANQSFISTVILGIVAIIMGMYNLKSRK